jgi:hypothetical protein
MANQSISPVLNRCNSQPLHNQSFTSRSYIMTHGCRPALRSDLSSIHAGVLDFIRFGIPNDCG